MFRKMAKEKAASRRNGLSRLFRALEQIKAQRIFLERNAPSNSYPWRALKRRFVLLMM
jgi:hypothetical protein